MAVSGPIQKKSSMSDDSSSDMMELEETALVSDAQLEQNLRRLREEQRLLLEQRAAMEAGAGDDIAALEHQDALRLNQLQQQELQKRQAVVAQRLALRHAHAQEDASSAEETAGPAAGVTAMAVASAAASVAAAGTSGCSSSERREPHDRNSRAPDAQPRRRAHCTVRVNNLHDAEAIETDV